MAAPLRARPVVALLTDFGMRDHYVAAIKGVILGICPEATLLDITHEIPAQDVLAGALELEAVAPYLPDGTVVVGVVDPGVGTSRRALAIDTGRLRLVGPDNGLFTLALRSDGTRAAVELTERGLQRPVVSRTFEARDRFGPAAAWLASGVEFASLGRPVSGLVTLEMPEAATKADGVAGVVLRVDRFGNLITNIQRAHLDAIPGPISIAIGATVVEGVSATYGDVGKGALCAIVGSTDRLEIAVSGGSAVERLGLARGAAVQVRRRAGA